jgi:hypothetical protein
LKDGAEATLHRKTLKNKQTIAEFSRKSLRGAAHQTHLTFRFFSRESKLKSFLFKMEN